MVSFSIFSNVIAMLRRKRGSPWFSENARKLFAELISTCDDNFNPIHIFSEKELKKATNNYSEQKIILTEGYYNLYKGVLPNSSVIVKKFKDDRTPLDPIKEIVFSSVFSSHSNVLKLLGCCLETECPILVFENAENGTLADHVLCSDRSQHVQPLSWKCRLNVLFDLCDAVAYLHNNFCNPIILRDIKPKTILLDRHNSAKLFDFSLSIAIPDGYDEVEDSVKGTIGYIAPECFTGYFDEKIDVFSVGMVMLQLLTGERLWDFSRLDIDEEVLLKDFVGERMREDRLNDIIEPAILEESWPGKDQQLQNFAVIALSCLRDVEERPTIIEVARQLSEMYPSQNSSS